MVRPVIALGSPFFYDVCRIFDLEPETLAAIEISFHPDDFVRLTTTRFVKKEEAEELKAVLADYAVVELKKE